LIKERHRKRMALSIVFPNQDELGKAKEFLSRLGYEYQEINRLRELGGIRVPFLVLQGGGNEAVHSILQARIALCGRVEYRPPLEGAVQDLPTPPEAAGHTFSYMEGGRMISLFRSKIAVAKAHEVVDGYATLWGIKCWINDVWARRHNIERCYESRREISVIEIFKRLPGTNCEKCGELTCLAFAALILQGKHRLSECRPVFEDGQYPNLLPPLQQIADGYGL
jgi:hypothetical protein